MDPALLVCWKFSALPRPRTQAQRACDFSSKVASTHCRRIFASNVQVAHTLSFRRNLNGTLLPKPAAQTERLPQMECHCRFILFGSLRPPTPPVQQAAHSRLFDMGFLRCRSINARASSPFLLLPLTFSSYLRSGNGVDTGLFATCQSRAPFLSIRPIGYSRLVIYRDLPELMQ
jgi:hypothetical protein